MGGCGHPNNQHPYNLPIQPIQLDYEYTQEISQMMRTSFGARYLTAKDLIFLIRHDRGKVNRTSRGKASASTPRTAVAAAAEAPKSKP